MFFFFKQKTAYEIKECDWSSDVCSSDLAGFIGSSLLAALEARGEHDLVVCDRLGSGDKWRNIAKREIAALVAPEDLGALLAETGDRVRAIFHMGAISATTERDADLIARENFALSLRLWAFCADHDTRSEERRVGKERRSPGSREH